MSNAFERATGSTRAPFDKMARKASAPSSARMAVSGTSCVTNPSGGGSGNANPVRSVPVAGALSFGITCETAPFDTSIKSCVSSSDSKIPSNSPGRTGAAVEKVTRTSGMSLVTTVRPNMVARVRMTSANFAFAKSNVADGGGATGGVGRCACAARAVTTASVADSSNAAPVEARHRGVMKITGGSRESPGSHATRVAACGIPSSC